MVRCRSCNRCRIAAIRSPCSRLAIFNFFFHKLPPVRGVFRMGRPRRGVRGKYWVNGIIERRTASCVVRRLVLVIWFHRTISFRGHIRRRSIGFLHGSVAMSRGSLASYRHFLSDLLLTDDELLNPGWEPSVSLEVFFQLRLRPAVYFLQRCLCDERGVSGPAPRIPAAEKAELKDWLFRLLGTIVSPP